MTRFAIYHHDDGKTVDIIQSDDDGVNWGRFRMADANVGLVVDALNLIEQQLETPDDIT